MQAWVNGGAQRLLFFRNPPTQGAKWAACRPGWFSRHGSNGFQLYSPSGAHRADVVSNTRREMSLDPGRSARLRAHLVQILYRLPEPFHGSLRQTPENESAPSQEHLKSR